MGLSIPIISVSLTVPTGRRCHTPVRTAQKDLEAPGQERSPLLTMPSCQPRSPAERVPENQTEAGWGFLRTKGLFAIWLNSWYESVLC